MVPREVPVSESKDGGAKPACGDVWSSLSESGAAAVVSPDLVRVLRPPVS